MFMIFMTMINVYAALTGVYGRGIAKYGILTLCTLLAAGIFGLLRLQKWGWALVTAGCLLWATGYFFYFSKTHVPFFLVQGLFGLSSSSTSSARKPANACASVHEALQFTKMTPPTAELGTIQIDLTPRRPVRKPEWLKAKAPGGDTFHNLKKLARDLNLHTVCESAQCPNIGECWNQKSATFMMLGNLCTRRCGFCAVPKGKPEPIDFDEPRRVAYAVAQLGLAHAVITSVNRDDDNLGAARAFVEVIREIRAQSPGTRVEVLTPDFQGNDESLRMVVAARARNPQPQHRDRPAPLRHREIRRPLSPLARVPPPRQGTLAPTAGHQDRHHRRPRRRDPRTPRRLPRPRRPQSRHPHHRPVSPPRRDHLVMQRFYTPDEFAFLKHEALAMGFRHVESGPLVRSSYHAQQQAESTGLA